MLTFHIFKKYSHVILLILLFIGITIVRFWKSAALFNFTFTEEMHAVMAYDQMKNFHVIWIGVSAANIKYYLGPGFTYFTYLLFLFSKGDPIIMAYFSSFLGIATAICLYIVTSDIISKKVALYATIIYGFSSLINFQDRRYWNPTPIPIITILLLYSLIKANKDARWYILTSILIGILFHIHLSLLLLLIPTAYSIVKNFKKIKLPTWIGMITSYFILTLPLLVFDIVHNFDNLLMPLHVLKGDQSRELAKLTLSGTLLHLHNFLSTLGRIWFIKLQTDPQNQIVIETHRAITEGNIFLTLLSLAALVWFFVKFRKKGFEIFLIPLAIIAIAYILYPSYNPEYYLMSFITIMTIVIGYFLASINRDITIGILTLFVAVNSYTTFHMSDMYGLTIKKELVKKTMNVIHTTPFSLETQGPLENPFMTYSGWRYLFKAYGKTPTNSSIDATLGWIYPDEIGREKPKLHVIVYDTIMPKTKQQPLSIVSAGIYHAYIFKEN